MKPSIAAKLQRSKPSGLDALGAQLERLARARARRRRLAALGLAACACLGGLALEHSRQSRQLDQGALQAGEAIAVVRGALAMWTPQRGYGALHGRELRSLTPWGAEVSLRPLGDGSGMAAEFAFATKSQCRGIVEGAQAYFERSAVDGRRAPQDDPGSACSGMGQNTVLLTKLDPRSRAMALDAGERSAIAGGIIPQQARPASASEISQARPGALAPLPPLSAQPQGGPPRP